MHSNSTVILLTGTTNEGKFVIEILFLIKCVQQYFLAEINDKMLYEMHSFDQYADSSTILWKL